MWRRAGGRDGNWYVSVCVDITSGMIGRLETAERWPVWTNLE